MKPKRILAIGDIHGAYKALLQVLERSSFNKEEDQLIFLGDYADGWSQTSELVDHLITLKKECKFKPIFIRGNHDVWVYDWFKYGIQPVIWTQQGGQATINSYIRTGKLVDEDHKTFWLEDQVNWFIDDQNRLFIHAGWDYRFNDDFNIAALSKVNGGSIAMECHWDRSIIESTMSAESTKNKFKELEKFKEIYIGHTALRNALPYNYLNLWNLDTGAGWSGKLTIMDINTKKYWQSNFVKELYPEEKGR